MGEIESAIGIEQLNKLDKAIKSRQNAAKLLTDKLSNIDGLKLPMVREDCTHVFYFYAMKHMRK